MSLSIIDLLKHIRDEMQFLIADSKNFTFDSFSSDKKTILSYTRSFEIIGEACKNIPESFRQEYPQVDWKGFCRLTGHNHSSILRNRLYSYLGHRCK